MSLRYTMIICVQKFYLHKQFDGIFTVMCSDIVLDIFR